MFDSPEHADKVNGKIPTDLDKPVWGAVEISKIINRNPRQTHHLLTSGLIKSARRIGGRWVANAAALRREFGGA
jgi:hypothetical protein